MRKNKLAIGPVGSRWDRMSKAERLAAIRKEPSMNDPRWTALADRWAGSTWAGMTSIQREATLDLFSTYSL